MLLGIYHVRVKYPDQEEQESEEAEPTVVAVAGEEPYDEVSVELERGPWGVEVEEPDAIWLDDTVPGLRDPREPRPELAEASPHSRSEREGRPPASAPADVPGTVPPEDIDEEIDEASNSMPQTETDDGQSDKEGRSSPEEEENESTPAKQEET